MKQLLFLILFSIDTCSIFSQINPPDAGEIFRDDVIPRIDITIENAAFQVMQQNKILDAEYPISFRFDNSFIKDTVDSVVITLKGNFSRYQDKKSYQITLNKPIKGRKFYGMNDINLVANALDPLMIRPRLAWYVAREIGLTPLFTNYVNLYINGNYTGVYIITEQIDDIFIKKWFNNNSGNLYKCKSVSSLQYVSDYQEDYKDPYQGFASNDRKYDLKINATRDDYSDLVRFIKVLNDSLSPNIRDSIAKYFNVQSYLKTLAFEIFIGHWDNYTNWGNNYMLYNNPSTQQFEFITFDLDLTIGSYAELKYIFCNIYSPGTQLKNRPLTNKLLAIKEFRDMYSFYHRQLISKFPGDSVQKIANILRNKIKPYIVNDPYYLKSYSINDFDKNMDSIVKAQGSVRYGLMNFFSARIDSTLKQLDSSNTAPIISNLKYNKIYISDTLNISCIVENEDEKLKVELLYKLEKDHYDTLKMSVYKHSSIPFANNCNARLSSLNTSGALKIKIKATDEKGNIGYYPLVGDYIINVLKPKPNLKLNEILAKNTNSITDEFGEHDDWIEIINKDTAIVFTDNCYLSDDAKNKGKWKLPKMVLKPNDLMFVWADNDPGQGEYHANFKLGGNGETIYLSEKQKGVYQILDSLSYSDQKTDISYGPLIDGTNKFEFLQQITPGFPNTAERLAYVIFNIKMNKQIKTGKFKVAKDAIDVVGNFNHWKSTNSFSDPDKDSIYTYTVMNMHADDTIEFRFRMKHNNNSIEFSETAGPEMHRRVILNEGCNILNFVFNNDSSLVSVDQIKYNGFKIYPNPVTNQFIINSSNTLKSISIINLTGQTVFSSNEINSFSKSINVSNLPVGIYFVKAIIGNREYTTKMVKAPN